MNWLRKVAFGERAIVTKDAGLVGAQCPSEEGTACSNSPELARKPHEVASGSCGTAREVPPSEEHGACSSVPVLLAPMAVVNDIAFRQLSLELGCDITYTEMVSSKALSFAN